MTRAILTPSVGSILSAEVYRIHEEAVIPEKYAIEEGYQFEEIKLTEYDRDDALDKGKAELAQVRTLRLEHLYRRYIETFSQYKKD